MKFSSVRIELTLHSWVKVMKHPYSYHILRIIRKRNISRSKFSTTSISKMWFDWCILLHMKALPIPAIKASIIMHFRNSSNNKSSVFAFHKEQYDASPHPHTSLTLSDPAPVHYCTSRSRNNYISILVLVYVHFVTVTENHPYMCWILRNFPKWPPFSMIGQIALPLPHSCLWTCHAFKTLKNLKLQYKARLPTS